MYLLRQRFFSLAFFLFKSDALEHGVKKPCVTFLNETDIVQLLLDKDRRIRLLIYNIFFKCLSCFTNDKHFNGNIFEHLEVRGVQSVQRQLSRNVVKVSSEDICIKEPKTKAGNRYVYFSPEMGTLLKEYRRYCETESLHYEGWTITDNDFLFRKHDLDEPMTPTTFTWKFKLIFKKNDLPYNLNVHSLRHKRCRRPSSERRQRQAA